MHGMLFQLCVHVLIFVMLAFFYCLAAFPNLPDSHRAIHSHQGNSPLPSRWSDSNLQSSGYEPDEFTDHSTPLLPLLFLFFHDSHRLLGRDRTSA
ncbi:hypothetical protein VNO78_35277 [Psophocarpus tetragonolobus]|uniref:Secreted protein n=1 Tax=Psophocarpus tetragonolobus TaxID=3891 RepID=A0AAN9NMZ5_PSOTE